MKRITLLSILLGMVFFGGLNAFGATFYVPTLAYPTIQAGIEAASAGETVLVANGTYTGVGNNNLDFLGKAITVQCESGPENCIIDCEHNSRGFYFHGGEGQDSVLSGFSIVNGVNIGGGGGGIRCQNSSPTIANCIIRNNDGAPYGGGIKCGEDCNATITNCIISKNDGGNGGGGIYCSTSSPTISNCTIAGNSGVGIYVDIRCSPIITNTIFWGDSHPVEIQIPYRNSIPVVIYSDIVGGYEGEGNIDIDPLFVDADNGDYRLAADSSCIDAGTSHGAPNIDIEGYPRPHGYGVDIGAYESPNFGTHNFPVADAGPDEVVFSEITLNGSLSWDLNDDIVSYNWMLRHTEDPSYDRTANGLNPTIADLESGFYYVDLTVTDSNGFQDTDSMLLAAAGSCIPIVYCDPNAIWKNHGEYVSCVTNRVKKLVSAGIITKEEGKQLIASAAHSDVGK